MISHFALVGNVFLVNEVGNVFLVLCCVTIHSNILSYFERTL